MKFIARYKCDTGYAYKSVDADNVTEALFLLAVKFPELDFDRKDIFLNAGQLKKWFSERGMFL